MKKVVSSVATVALLAAGLGASTVLATGSKTMICHATGSASNPYVEITISNNAVEAHRHHQDREDIIPAPQGGCPGEPGDITETVTVTLPGTTTTVTTPGTTVTLPAQTVTNTNTVTINNPGAVVTLPAVTLPVVTLPAVTTTITTPGKTKTVTKIKVVKSKPKIIVKIKYRESKKCLPVKKATPRCEGDCRPTKLREGASG
jgi:hypothetical protein